jgi:hypothetical protein
MKQQSIYIIIELLSMILAISSCKTDSRNDSQMIPPKHYDSFNDFKIYITSDSLNFSPIQLTNLSIQKIGEDTSIHYFNFKNLKLGIATILNREKPDSPCDSLYSYYSIINNQLVYEESIPDSLRNWGFGLKDNSDFNLELKKAKKFELNGVNYLFIPSSISECIGGFCNLKIDHLFQIKNNNKVTYLTVDGWNICDINKDNQLDQIVFNDNAIDQLSFIEKLKNKRPSEKENKFDKKYLNIQIWTFENNKWRPLIDKNNNPYFIFLEINDYKRDSFKIIDYNWIKEL